VPQIIGLIIVIVIISAVVGAIAQFLNKLGEMNAPARRPPPRRPSRRDDEGPAAAPARPPSADRDMDRFLAEIDRLRRKNTDSPSAASSPPVAQPVRPSARPVDRARPRVVAELAEPAPPPPPSRRVEQPAQTYTPHAQPVAAQIEQLPLAQVVAPSSSTGAPATRVTRLSAGPKGVPKSDFAQNLFNLLGSPQGVAIAVVVQEVLGPPKSKRG
jgi:hypothetical protein